MRLFHFTAVELLPQILEDGFLRVCESNISPTREHAGTDVVWLTSNPDPLASAGPMLTTTIVDETGRVVGTTSKTGARIEVDIPSDEAHWWPDWSRRQGIKEKFYKALAVSAAPARPRQWYVVERPVPSIEWVAVTSGAGDRELARPRQPIRDQPVTRATHENGISYAL